MTRVEKEIELDRPVEGPVTLLRRRTALPVLRVGRHSFCVTYLRLEKPSSAGFDAVRLTWKVGGGERGDPAARV